MQGEGQGETKREFKCCGKGRAEVRSDGKPWRRGTGASEEGTTLGGGDAAGMAEVKGQDREGKR